ncbi:hypothetical protein ACSAZL_06150 [Methanosarcina sp. T3]|uniref:hypothetical protein n=1 Tax=Methanosarcina sp. T3 TaxID=3439062 RepID=UPI003F8628F1
MGFIKHRVHRCPESLNGNLNGNPNGNLNGELKGGTKGKLFQVLEKNKLNRNHTGPYFYCTGVNYVQKSLLNYNFRNFNL